MKSYENIDTNDSCIKKFLIIFFSCLKYQDNSDTWTAVVPIKTDNRCNSII